jgi:predicted oxidoreductase (fatty acid repression mutant protein)
MSFVDLIQKRRTIYAIGKNLQHSPEQLNDLIQTAIKHSPSSFNSQSSRAVVLFGDSHAKLWEIVRETLRKIVPTDAFESTNNKINSFAAGFGTVLFFEDQAVIEDLQQRFAAYAENFPAFSEQSGGMAQFAVWTALADVGIGASLQHYNPIIDAEVAQVFDLPASWKLRSQLVFGSIEAAAGDKSFIDDGLRFKTFY